VVTPPGGGLIGSDADKFTVDLVSFGGRHGTQRYQDE
jgi:hypothetical protein